MKDSNRRRRTAETVEAFYGGGELLAVEQDLPFHWIVFFFGVFIVARGGTHTMES